MRYISLIGVRSNRDDIPDTFSSHFEPCKTMAEYSGHNMYKDLISKRYKVIGCKVLTENQYIKLAENNLLHSIFVY